MITALAGVALVASSMATDSSAYTGSLFVALHEPVRACIAERESEGQRDAVNASGKHRGPYQMTDALTDGGLWMAMPELRKRFGARQARVIRIKYQRIPMDRWDWPWLQDLTFWAVWDHGNGAKHWAGGRWSCAL